MDVDAAVAVDVDVDVGAAEDVGVGGDKQFAGILEILNRPFAEISSGDDATENYANFNTSKKTDLVHLLVEFSQRPNKHAGSAACRDICQEAARRVPLQGETLLKLKVSKLPQLTTLEAQQMYLSSRIPPDGLALVSQRRAAPTPSHRRGTQLFPLIHRLKNFFPQMLVLMTSNSAR